MSFPAWVARLHRPLTRSAPASAGQGWPFGRVAGSRASPGSSSSVCSVRAVHTFQSCDHTPFGVISARVRA